jgi:hypothetical protein
MRRIISVFAVLLLAGLLACGGGGGGNPTPVYSGIQTAAPLDNTLAAGQFAYAILAPAEAGAVGPLALSPGSNNSVSASLSFKSAVLRAVRTFIPPVGTAGAVRPRAVSGGTIHGDEGGTATITVTTGVWTGGTVYVTRIDVAFNQYDDSVDGMANPIQGTMSIVPDTWYGDGTPAYFVASFDLHVSLGPGSGGRITGSLDYHQVSNEDMRHVYTWNDTLITDDETKIQVWWNPLVEVDEDIYPDRELLTISGQVYVSFLGYVTISPIEPFDYPTGTEPIPVSGKFFLTGGPGKATVTVHGISPEVFVELDRDGGGGTDTTGTHTWEELAF